MVMDIFVFHFLSKRIIREEKIINKRPKLSFRSDAIYITM